MVVLLIVLILIISITADVLVRYVTHRIGEARLRKARAAALDLGVRLEFTAEARSLKRVVVENPRARILAVDDEAVVLDSFRKILVLAGYSIDTVETGKEALGLIQKNEYDFLFTDLKMPEMDGLEVTKAAKHLKPDLDVIMITGYGTIESAVGAMKYGALDYVQKPFTEEELIGFVGRSLIRRQARIEKQIRPKLHLVTPSTAESASQHVFNVPAGLFFAPKHTWVAIEPSGAVRIGADDFARKNLGPFDEIVLPKQGKKVGKGEALFFARKGTRTAAFRSPISGTVVSVNEDLQGQINLFHARPYETGWICTLEPSDLTGEIKDLKIGGEALNWYQKEIDRFLAMTRQNASTSQNPEEAAWKSFSEAFL